MGDHRCALVFRSRRELLWIWDERRESGCRPFGQYQAAVEVNMLAANGF